MKKPQSERSADTVSADDTGVPVLNDRAMAENWFQHLRVLIANDRRDRLELLAQVVTGLRHEVIAREVNVKEVGASTAREPDVALVGLGQTKCRELSGYFCLSQQRS